MDGGVAGDFVTDQDELFIFCAEAMCQKGVGMRCLIAAWIWQWIDLNR
jgi:hypothetical protein